MYIYIYIYCLAKMASASISASIIDKIIIIWWHGEMFVKLTPGIAKQAENPTIMSSMRNHPQTLISLSTIIILM